MKWFKFKSTKRIERLTGKVEILQGLIIELKENTDKHLVGHAYSSDMIDDYVKKAMIRIEEVDNRIAKWEEASLISMEALEKAIDRMDLTEQIKKLSERTGKNELMFTAVFKKANDTYSRGMRGLISQSAKCSMYAAELAEQKLIEIRKEIDDLILTNTDKIVGGVADEYQNKLNDFESKIEKKYQIKTIRISVNGFLFDMKVDKISHQYIVDIACEKHPEFNNSKEFNVSFTYDQLDKNHILIKDHSVSLVEGMKFVVIPITPIAEKPTDKEPISNDSDTPNA